MKALVIEDEILASRSLVRLLNEAGIEVITTLDTIVSVIDWFKNNRQPDLVFMDIHLADGSAFKIFELITISCPIIFTTAYDVYAVRAFKVNSIDYLLKPVTREAIDSALKKLRNLSGLNQVQVDLQHFLDLYHKEKAYKTHFLVPVKGSKLIPLLTEDIACFCIEDGLVKAKTIEGKSFLMENTLDELANMVNPAGFFRANRQFIIAKGAVKEVSFWFNNRLSVELKIPLSEKIIISKVRASEFKDWYSA